MKHIISAIIILFSSFFFITNGYSSPCITDAAGKSDTLKVYGNTSSAKLWADVKPPEGAAITRVWAEIYPPTPVSVTPVAELIKIDDASSRYEGVYTGFTQKGEYFIEYYAEDSNGACKDTATGIVKKVSEDEYEPDDAADQARPIQVNAVKPQQRNFHKSGDADWVKFLGAAGEHYTITVTNTNALTNAVIEIYDADGITLLKQSDNNESHAGKELYLEWDCPKDSKYYLKLKNDFPEYFGEHITYELKVQIKIAGDEGIITGVVINGISKKPVKNAELRITKYAEFSNDDGTYEIRPRPCTDCTLIAKADGYETMRQIVNIVKAKPLTIDFALFPGDISGDGMVSLSDLIFALQIIAGDDGNIILQADVNQDKRIGWEEVFYILRKIGGLI